MTREQRESLDRYEFLLERLVRGDITASAFESEFLHRFKTEELALPVDAFNILDALFGDVDAFCSDPNQRGPDDLGEEELLRSVKSALQKLRTLKEHGA